MEKIFIVNPNSGNGDSIKIAKEIKALLDSDNEKYHIYYTTAPKDATYIAALHRNCIVYSVGGDGTLFEVVNGLAKNNSALGIIPVGSGNDFIKTINSDDEYTYADLCKMNEHYFINIGSVGIDADIAHNQVKIKKRKIPKSLTYKASIIETFSKFETPHVKITIDDETLNQDITILAMCNGRYYGGGFQIAPNANINDGKFDVYLADGVSKPQILKMLMQVIRGTHESSRFMHKFLSDKVRIESKVPLNCNLDGEIFKLTDMNFSVTDKQIPIYTADDKIKKLCKARGLYRKI